MPPHPLQVLQLQATYQGHAYAGHMHDFQVASGHMTALRASYDYMSGSSNHGEPAADDKSAWQPSSTTDLRLPAVTGMLLIYTYNQECMHLLSVVPQHIPGLRSNAHACLGAEC
jgi:hypothetical protein